MSLCVVTANAQIKVLQKIEGTHHNLNSLLTIYNLLKQPAKWIHNIFPRSTVQVDPQHNLVKINSHYLVMFKFKNNLV